jgi:AraC-like DNA-binding protein
LEESASIERPVASGAGGVVTHFASAPRVQASAPVGVLWRPRDPSRIRHTRYRPAPDLAAIIEHVWIVRWDLRGVAPLRQETLPHPSVHLVVEAGHSGLFGVPHGRFTKVLTGRGRAVGIKFRPGGFRTLWPTPVHALTGRVVSLAEAFGAGGVALEHQILAAADIGDPAVCLPMGAPAGGACGRRQAAGGGVTAPDTPRGDGPLDTERWLGTSAVDAQLVAHAEAFVRARRPSLRQVVGACSGEEDPTFIDNSTATVFALIDRIRQDRRITTVESLARAAGVSARTVQRLFRDHVGVSAKWVLCRQRLHDAATALSDGSVRTRRGADDAVRWARGTTAALAAELGYYDQAHFVRSFTALVGLSPTAYLRALVSHGAPA